MDTRQCYEACVSELKTYVEDAGFTDVVLGISGGIDSALTAVMCVDAFGANHVHGYLLPGPYSSDHSVIDGQALADNLVVKVQDISIVEPYEAFARAMTPVLGGLTGLASQNTQARCRMVCLMAISNDRGWLLINTGNKSEAMMGYSTLYGDTAGAFAPLGGLYKTQVYEIARWCNEYALQQGGVAPIPQNILIKPPSAELAPNQNDEAGLGIDYETLDGILIPMFEYGRSDEQIAALGFNGNQVADIRRRALGWAFKRAQEPPFPQAKFYDEN